MNVGGARRYHVRHETIYHYGGEVAHSHHLLHLTPRATPNQTCLAHRIELEPSPSARRDEPDAFGNLATRLEYDRPHERLLVLADIEVEVRTPQEAPAADTDAWELVHGAQSYGAVMPPQDLDACRFRMESSFVRVKQIFTDYAADCFTPASPVLAAAESLMHKIHREFTYAPGSTTIRTSVVEALAARRGVCQDFTHVMLACLRSRGLAARYVSGYLRTARLEGELGGSDGPDALQGADASHAWVSVYCPPAGWVDLDPTNDVRCGTDHVTVAWGRDFGDVSPLRGVIVGGGRHRLSVRVSVRPG